MGGQGKDGNHDATKIVRDQHLVYFKHFHHSIIMPILYNSHLVIVNNKLLIVGG